MDVDDPSHERNRESSVSDAVARAIASYDRVLASCLEEGAPVALLDIPSHTNVGDHAIFLGELCHLERTNHSLRQLSSISDYSKARLRERLQDSPTILLHGGGNLGDLWPHHQRFRECVLADFPRSRVVQLPQSVHFAEEPALERARRAFGQHPDFTLLVRDRYGLEFARREFSCRVELCPDAAFQLGLQPRPVNAATEILILGRTDHETQKPLETPATVPDFEMQDWIDPGPRGYRVMRRLGAEAAAKARWSRLTAAAAAPLVRRVDVGLAQARVRYGLTVLSRGRVVVTDRLHGHILCTLLRIPHVIHDAGYGKVAAYYETWSAELPIARICATPDEAYGLARTLVRDLQSEP